MSAIDKLNHVPSAGSCCYSFACVNFSRRYEHAAEALISQFNQAPKKSRFILYWPVGSKHHTDFFRRELVAPIWCWRVKRGQVREGVGQLVQSQASFFNNGEKIVANSLKGAAAKRTASKRQFVIGRFRGKDGNRNV